MKVTILFLKKPSVNLKDNFLKSLQTLSNFNDKNMDDNHNFKCRIERSLEQFSICLNHAFGINYIIYLYIQLFNKISELPINKKLCCRINNNQL